MPCLGPRATPPSQRSMLEVSPKFHRCPLADAGGPPPILDEQQAPLAPPQRRQVRRRGSAMNAAYTSARSPSQHARPARPSDGYGERHLMAIEGSEAHGAFEKGARLRTSSLSMRCGWLLSCAARRAWRRALIVRGGSEQRGQRTTCESNRARNRLASRRNHTLLCAGPMRECVKGYTWHRGRTNRVSRAPPRQSLLYYVRSGSAPPWGR